MLFADQTEAGELFLVGMADVAVVQNQSLIFCTPPLGACLAVTIFDPVAKVAGVLNGMLPESSIDRDRAARRPGMFFDTGITDLLARAAEMNADAGRLIVCVAGGARILDETSYFNIGNRNFEVIAQLLNRAGFTIAAQDVGGLTNRALQMNAATGEVRLKLSGQAKMKTLCKP